MTNCGGECLIVGGNEHVVSAVFNDPSKFGFENFAIGARVWQLESLPNGPRVEWWSNKIGYIDGYAMTMK